MPDLAKQSHQKDFPKTMKDIVFLTILVNQQKHLQCVFFFFFWGGGRHCRFSMKSENIYQFWERYNVQNFWK